MQQRGLQPFHVVAGAPRRKRALRNGIFQQAVCVGIGIVICGYAIAPYRGVGQKVLPQLYALADIALDGKYVLVFNVQHEAHVIPVVAACRKIIEYQVAAFGKILPRRAERHVEMRRIGARARIGGIVDHAGRHERLPCRPRNEERAPRGVKRPSAVNAHAVPIAVLGVIPRAGKVHSVQLRSIVTLVIAALGYPDVAHVEP